MTDTTTVRARPEQIWQDLGDETVILDLHAGTYYGLNTVGASVWRLIQTPRTFADLHRALLEEFDVESDRCRQDLAALLETLASRGMIDVDEGVQ